MEAHRKGARLANVDQNGLTPLHHAARLGRKDVVQYLVDNSEMRKNIKLFRNLFTSFQPSNCPL